MKHSEVRKKAETVWNVEAVKVEEKKDEKKKTQFIIMHTLVSSQRLQYTKYISHSKYMR